jgi:predicted nucleic acid-binding protein
VIVLDASVLANVVADDASEGDRARAALLDANRASIPDLADVETAAVMRKRWLAGDLTENRLVTALADLRELDLDRYPALPLLQRACELKANVSVYDGIYVALAEALDCALLTADARLASAAGPRCPIELLSAPRSSG